MYRMIRFVTLALTCALSACASPFAPTRTAHELVLKDQPEREVRILVAFGNGVPRESARVVLGSVSQQLKNQTNITLRVSETYGHLDSTPTRNLGTFFKSWKAALTPNGEQYDIVHLFLPVSAYVPTSRQEHELGYAEGVGIVGRVPNAFSYTRLTGDLEVDTWSMLHELGHLLGAEHASAGIMRADQMPQVLYYSADSLIGMLGDRSRLVGLAPASYRAQFFTSAFKSY